jgi:hypothetical protein
VRVNISTDVEAKDYPDVIEVIENAKKAEEKREDVHVNLMYFKPALDLIKKQPTATKGSVSAEISMNGTFNPVFLKHENITIAIMPLRVT